MIPPRSRLDVGTLLLGMCFIVTHAGCGGSSTPAGGSGAAGAAGVAPTNDPAAMSSAASPDPAMMAAATNMADSSADSPATPDPRSAHGEMTTYDPASADSSAASTTAIPPADPALSTSADAAATAAVPTATPPASASTDPAAAAMAAQQASAPADPTRQRTVPPQNAGQAAGVSGDPAAAANPPAAAMAADNPRGGDPAGAGRPANPGEAGGDGGGGQPASQAQKGTLEYAILRLAEMAKEGDFGEAEAIISKRAKGLAASIRDGELTDAKIESLKTSFDNLELFGRKNVGSGVQFVLKNSQGKYLQFVIAKEGSEFVIRDFVMR